MKKLSIIAIVFAVTFSACTKGFDEMNKDPFSPTGTTMEALFNGVVQSMQQNMNEQFYLQNEIWYPETELGALTSEAWGNSQIGTSSVWSDYYLMLSNIRELEKRFDDYCVEQGDDFVCDKVRAQLNILKAYQTFKVTDIFGDIPYSEAGRIWDNASSQSTMKPSWDTQESIYDTLLNELVWSRDLLYADSITTINGNEYYKLPYDVLLSNNYKYWADFANALILRHGLRMYDKDPDFATPLLVDAYNYQFTMLNQGGGSPTYGAIALWPSVLGTSWDVNWSFREHKNLRMGETVWSVLSSTDALDGSGIFDYRAFIFFDTSHKNDSLPDGAWRPYPQIHTAETPTEGGSPYAQSRDANYTFKGPACLYSPFNYYLTRDEKYVPQLFVTYADVLFMKAEIGARGIGGISLSGMELDQMLFQGIYQSCLLWTSFPQNTSRWTYKYPQYTNFTSNLDIWSWSNNMASNVMNYVVYMNPDFDWSNEAYLKLIIQQRWLNLFRQPWEAWALARRTMNTPTTTDHAKLTSFRLEYPQLEIEYNHDNYTAQLARMSHGDTRQTKVWWNE
ncbi:MAG: SusD/RagB family nutrient-binding outer membrane lipoprotein [Bacteroidales bacterium]|nr:SusD/RagB family nutrient-binding outer membrane lipoprotein [Bacteroidales bacterium]